MEEQENEIKEVKEKKDKSKKSDISEPLKVKKNLYLANGQIRGEISKSVLHTMIARWGDIIHIVPSNQWCTVDEIVQMVWEWEKKQYRKSFTRTRKQIEDGVRELLEADILMRKP